VFLIQSIDLEYSVVAKMASTTAGPAAGEQLADKAEGSLDVDWLIRKKGSYQARNHEAVTLAE